ncbi:MAG: hypothetical protein WBP61_14160 [Nocardioides sp.]
MRRALATLTVLLCALPIAACGDEETPADDGGAPAVVEVTFEGDSVTPNGERVDVATGQDVELQITADEAGEIHVHSDPEQEFAYESGESTVTIVGIDTPSTVDVESHSLDKVIVQLEVR